MNILVIHPGEVLVEEILSEECNSIKGKLLLSCTISFGIIKGGLIPTSISAFGISLSIENKKYLIFTLFLFCLYFLLKFITMVVSDYLKWKMKFYAAITAKYTEEGGILYNDTQGRLNVPGHNDKIDKFLENVKKNNWLRSIYDVLVPILYGLITIIIIIVSLYS